MFPDPGKAFKFLAKLHPDGYINLVTIHPESGKVKGITRKNGHTELLDFINLYEGRANLYYSINQPIDAPDTKLNKTHIQHVNALFLDIDPRKGADFDAERQRIKALCDDIIASDYPPNVVVDSGGGFQVIWLLDKPTMDFTLAEELGRGLGARYGSDAVQNIDRVLRLPFTTNIPTPGKRERGRVESVATVTYWNDKRYDWDTLKNICDPVPTPTYGSLDKEHADFDTSILNHTSWRDHPDLEKRLYKLMERDKAVMRLIFGDITLPSRSEYDFMLAAHLKDAEWDIDEVALALWLNPTGKGKGRELTHRDISRAYHRAQSLRDIMSLGEIGEKLTLEIKQSLTENSEVASIDESIMDMFNKYGIKPPKRLRPRHNIPLSTDADYLFYGFLGKRSLSVVYGQSNVGKSFAALDIAGHLVMGKDWAGKECDSKMAVLYVAAEAGQGIAKRERALRRRLGVRDDATFEQFPLVVETMDVNFFESPSEARDDGGDVIAWVKFYEAKYGIRFGTVVVDTLATSFAGGNENSTEDMTKYVGHMKRIQHGADVSVLIVHHSGKDQAAGARGSSALRAATDTELEVKVEKAGSLVKREIRVTKQREGELGEVIQFALKQVEVGTDIKGRPITTCSLILPQDAEFESVIPSKLDELEESERAMYNAIMVAQHHDSVNVRRKKHGDEHMMLINAYYRYFRENNTTDINMVQRLHNEAVVQWGIRAQETGVHRNTLHNHCTKLERELLIRENESGQWVIV
jgi:hypothetical protein